MAPLESLAKDSNVLYFFLKVHPKMILILLRSSLGYPSKTGDAAN
ncbi:hypothetical protein [Serratia symbiotica]|nr:hypothetical protein [Serratia symbiotica]